MKRYSTLGFAMTLVGLLLWGCLPQFAQNGTSVPTATPRVFLTITPKEDVQVLPRATRPNILLIITDDLDKELGTIQFMPHLQALMVSQGLSLDDFFISEPLCCPSRSTFLRGQYTHNHGIYRNDPPHGGFEEFYYLQNESSTLATWLQAAGYRTVLLGKYLNGYPFREDRTYVPVGWNEWYSAAKGSPFAGFTYTLNENGSQVDYNETGKGESQYMTDVLGRKAVDFITRSAQDDQPFFMYLSTYAPHEPVKAAPRHENLYPDLRAPRTPSFNEQDISDKPFGIRSDPLLTEEEIQNLDLDYRVRVQAMQAVDEMIVQLVDTLAATNQLDNTYIIFTSDNGYHLGQHRLRNGKASPYEEDIRVPFVIRGPGIEQGMSLPGYITGNVDFAPTVAELAGVVPPTYVDGQSMVQLFSSKKPSPDKWRSGYLLEFYGYNTSETPNTASPPTPNYLGLRTHEYLYVEYGDGFVELYDLVNDPFEMENIASKADKTLLASLSQWLHSLAKCSGSACTEIDNQIP